MFSHTLLPDPNFLPHELAQRDFAVSPALATAFRGAVNGRGLVYLGNLVDGLHISRDYAATVAADTVVHTFGALKTMLRKAHLRSVIATRDNSLVISAIENQLQPATRPLAPRLLAEFTAMAQQPNTALKLSDGFVALHQGAWRFYNNPLRQAA